MNKNTVSFFIIAIIFIVVLLGIYKFIYEPYALKQEYVACIKKAGEDDYQRWQSIEKEIAEKDKEVKAEGLKNDIEFKEFLQTYKGTQEYSEFLESCRSIDGLWEKLSCGDDPDENYRGSRRHMIYNQGMTLGGQLNTLYEKMDSNGAILEKETKECQEQYELFK